MESDRIIPGDVLDDLCSRFIINVPEHERKDLIRILFQIESAHWFYLDFYSKNFPGRKACGLREFTQQVFKHISFLQPFINEIDDIIEDWKGYKFCVPTFGGILLDEDLTHVLLVQSYRSSWGFPKGKVNKDERPCQCAIREVYEETGFDITNLIDANNYVEANINDQPIRLYIIPGVKKNEKFIPKTRNEIKDINWFPLCDIPLSRKDAKQWKLGSGCTNAVYNAFYMVSPFLRKLRQWIYEHNNQMPNRRRRPRHKSCSDIDFNQGPMDGDRKEMWKKMEEFGVDEVVKVDLNTVPEPSKVGDQRKKEEYDTFNCESLCITTQKQLTITHEGSWNSKDSSTKSSFPSLIFNPLIGRAALQAYKPSGQMFIPIEQNLPRDPQSFIKTIAKYSKEYSNSLINTKENDKVDDKELSHLEESLSEAPVFSSQIEPFSGNSAFKKFEKLNKQGKRRRRKRSKSNKGNEYSVISSETTEVKGNSMFQDENAITNGNVETEFKVLDSVPGWVGFKFDINSILQSMNDAVIQNGKLNIL